MKKFYALLIIIVVSAGYLQAQSKFSFYSLSWGMTREEVMKNPDFTDLSNYDDNSLYYRVNFSDYYDGIHFTFNEDEKLNEIYFFFKYKNEKKSYKFYRETFMNQYGQPLKTSKYKGTEEYTWEKDSTQIELTSLNVKYTDLHKYPILTKKTVVYDETFDDNKNNWGLENNDQALSQIANGELSVASKTSSGRVLTTPVKLDPSKDFTIECKMKHMDGVNNYGFGILWGHSNWDNSGEFLIADDGHFKISYSKGGDRGVRSWTEAYIHKDKEDNVLKIMRKNNVLEYYINGSMVCRSGYKGLQGERFGVIIYNQQTIAFDYFKITQYEKTYQAAPAKPNFGNLTIYTSDPDVKDINITIVPDMSPEEILKAIDKSDGLITRGHMAKLCGTMNPTSECLPINDFYDGTTGKTLNEFNTTKGPFDGYNWNNPKEADGDYYFSIDIPYGKYKVNLYKSEYNGNTTRTIYGTYNITIDKPCTILPLKKEK